MKISYNRNIHKLLFSSASIVAVTAIAITSSSSPSFSYASTNVAPKTSTEKLVAYNLSVYRSNFGFKFNYSSKDFVVSQKTNRGGSNSSLAIVNIWTKEHNRKIQAGAYEGGTEYPANVQVTVSKNPQRLPLLTWIQQNQNFAATRNFKTAKIANKNAIQFESSGLYEHKHIAVVNPKNSQIIVVTLAQVGSGNNDAVYRRAYEQVIQSLSFN
ncbi:hypothetical protein A0J48_009275 [Sphaerospermopsis aphanizomenoides BCCUSP55]|uniref:hypothetical protein n=1 Tax=Sphaerospermopsis aphanizomenoides TaxID=459663 RepID=UPI000ABB584E|nr:hypothetical protein [Sphaerospermopsis aphanizomenoides]MBK1987724.1 hypothetical protein [Sphaerospermopsis aphanizomenoides BCCUSP55]